MKKKRIFILMILIPLLSGHVSAQGGCVVLVPKIADSYTGGCKNGLAHGRGEAFGIDQYHGDFRKGLPDGVGTYIWYTGDKYEGEWQKGLRHGYGVFTAKSELGDTLLAGVWRYDRYLAEEVIPDYTILYRQGVGRVTCMKVGKTPVYYIRYKFTRGGEWSGGTISDLLLTGSSGAERITDTMIGFENVEFPFEGKVRFSAPNAFYSSILSCEVRFVINDPGAWIVTIYY